MPAADAARTRYRQFADRECRGYSDLYYRLSLWAADDGAIMDFIAHRPDPQPNLFLAAVQFVTGVAGMPSTASALRAVVDERKPDIARIMATRRTQTNEVGRCSAVLAALPPGPLALVEVGASAGLCLLLDRYSYDYGSVRVGPSSSTVQLACALNGTIPPSLTMPQVVWRRGLDIAPIDPRDDEAVRWLLACVWSDHPHRRERLAAAVSLARPEPPLVAPGDLVDDLPSLVAQAPTDARLVVFHSAVLGYLTPERRRAFETVLTELSRTRDIVWVSNEPPGVVPRVAPPPTTDARLQFVLARKTLTRGVATTETLALVHPHGSEMTWLA